MDWYTWFLLGNLISDAAIALFAYKVSIFDRDVDKRFTRLRYLRMSNRLTIPSEIYNGNGLIETIEIDPLKLSDEFIINLELNIPDEDKKQLFSPIPYTKLPKNGMEIQKYVLYGNRDKILGLIREADSDYQKKIGSNFNRYFLNHLLYIFFIGIIIESLSWIYGIWDP